MDRDTAGPLVGRAGELLALGELVTSVAGGHGGLCWIQGEAGSGKSALADAALAKAAALGCRTLHVTPDGLLTSELTGEALTGQAREELAGGGLIGGVVALGIVVDGVARACAEAPLVLALGGLHEAGEGGLLLWKLLAGVARHHRLLLIGTARPAPQRPSLAGALAGLRELVEQRDGTILELSPLDGDSVAALAGAIAGGTAGPRLLAALSRAGGNPLYVTLFARAFIRNQNVQVRGGIAELVGEQPDGIPAELYSVISQRLTALPGALAASLTIAAVLGGEFNAREWAAATGAGPVDVAEAVTAAALDGVLGADTASRHGRLRFRHPVVRDVLLAQVPDSRLRVLRGSVAAKLADGGCGVAAVARLLRDLPGPVPDWVLDWLASCGEPELDAAPLAAAELLSRAAAGAPEHPKLATLTVRLAQVLSWLGHAEEACALSEMTARAWSAAGDIEAAAKLRVQSLGAASQVGRPELASWALLGPVDDGLLAAPWWARVAAWSAVALHASGEESDKPLELATQAAELALACGDPIVLAHARFAQAMCGPGAARDALLAAALAALPGPDPESERVRSIVLATRITESAEAGTFDAETVTDGLRFAARSSRTRAFPVLLAAANWHYQAGRWDAALDCLAQADQALDDTVRANTGLANTVIANTGLASTVLASTGAPTGGAVRGGDDGTRLPGPHDGLAAVIALRRGDRATADARLRRATPRASYLIDRALALRAEADGDFGAATALMTGWLTSAHTLLPRDLNYLCYVALAAGDVAVAGTAASLSATAAEDGSPGRVATARFCAALVADPPAESDTDSGAAAELLAVAEYCGAHGWVPLQASVLEEAAVRLAAAGSGVEARAALTSAARSYAALGATWDLQRADARLRELGVRRGPNSLPRRPARGWAALTPKERDVARLAAQGRSNGEIAAELFLSPRTVQTHITKILAKLSLTSRVEIVRVAAANPGD